LLYVFAVVNLLSGALHSNTLESPQNAKKKGSPPLLLINIVSVVRSDPELGGESAQS
jgi:hypothetical protein